MNQRITLSAILVATVLLGAGCNPKDQAPAKSGSPSSERPAPVQGFGLLPAIQSPSRPGMEVSSNFAAMGRTSVQVSAVAPMAAATDKEAPADMVVSNVGGGSSMAIRAPYPMPGELKVVYDLKSDLPTWSADGSVYRVRQPSVSTGLARSISDAAGVPSQVAALAQEIQGANVSWRDASGFIWNVDLPGRNLNWWKNVDYSAQQDDTSERKLDAEAVKRAADDFLRRHGFGELAGKGVIEENPMIMPLLRGESIPCVMSARPEAAPSAAGDAKLMIYPSPCGYPIQVTVYYPDTRDGMDTVDMGGWMSRKASVQIDIKDNSVVGGNVMLPTSEDMSSYPLISMEEAKTRLMQGGNNPVYGWDNGSGAKEVRVSIDRVTLGYMRHDSWDNMTMRTYFLPALIVEGAVNRGGDQTEPETYRTVVPLVADKAFQNNPNPIMYMKAEPAVEVAPPADVPKPLR